MNKALADSKEFAKGVLDHNPFEGEKHYPAWALDPRMVARPYDGMGHPVVNRNPAGPTGGGIPEMPHRYYGGGLANYRNTVDPLEHWWGVQAMAAEYPNSIGSGNFKLRRGNDDVRPNATDRTDTDGYGMYTNRRVWRNPQFAGFDGSVATYLTGDIGKDMYGLSRNHNLTFLPLRPADGFEPGGTLVKRGVTSPNSDGSNSRLEWMVHDSSPIQVHGGHDLSTYQVLGMPMPGSFHFGQLQHEWPDYPLDPNRTYLLATMYYEASFLSPFYIIRDPKSRYLISDPVVGGRTAEVVGRVPRMVMRPVFCRVLIQPLGVNQGPWASFKKGVSAAYAYVDDAVGGAISRNVSKVKEKVTGAYEKAKELWDKLNPIQFLVNAISKGAQAVTEKSAGLICKAGQMADYTAGSTGGEVDDTNDLDEGGGNRQSRQEALQRCRQLDVAQEVEENACPEGASDGGLCGAVPKMEVYANYSDMFTVNAVAGENEKKFGVERGFYERPHWVDSVRIGDNIYASSPPSRISPGPLQFGYFPPGATFALPQLTKASSSWLPAAGVGGDFPYESTDLTLPSGSSPTTRCPTEWEMDQMGAPAPGAASWTSSTTSWQKAVKSHWDAHNPATPAHPDPRWGHFPPYEQNPPTLGEENVRQAYSDGLCAPMHVAFGCDAGPDGQCPGAGGFHPSWSSAAAAPGLVGVPVLWRAVDPSSSDAVPNFLDVEITSLSTEYGRVNFYTGSSSVRTQGAALFKSSDFLFKNSAPHPELYRIPASWLWKKTNDDELTPLSSQGMIFGSLQGLSVKYQYNRGFSNYEGLCSGDVERTDNPCSKDTYFGDLASIPTKRDSVGMDPQGLGNPLQDYRAFVNDVATVYALGPGSSYTIRVRGVLEEAGGRTLTGAWSNTLSLSSSQMCGLLNPNEGSYENFFRALGCGSGTESYGAEGITSGSTHGFVDPGVNWVWQMVDTDVCSGFFDSTPASLTWGVPGVARGWGIVWVISMVSLVFLIFWQGVRMTYDMWMHGGWANQRDPGFREAVPRFFLALILAAASLLLCRLVLILVSNISCYVSKSAEVGLWNILGWFLGLVVAAILAAVGKAVLAAFYSGPGAIAVFIALLGLILMLIGFFLTMFSKVLLQLLIRVALLAVLIVLSPLAFVLMATPDTEQWTHKWVGMFVTMSIMQTLQLLTLYLAAKVYSLFAIAGSGSGIPLFTGLVVGIVILYLVSKIPEILDRYLGRDVVSGGAAPGMAEKAVGGADKGINDYLKNRGGNSGGGQPTATPPQPPPPPINQP